MEYSPQRIIQKRTDFGDKALRERFGERFRSYRDIWTRASRRETVTDFPLYLQLELSPYCNLSCDSCIHGHREIRDEYVAIENFMDKGLYEKIIQEASSFGCPSISFHNNSEPLLINDLEEKIVSASRAGFIDIILVTNATLLNQERALRLLKSGLTKISFSIDAFSEEAYRKNRKNGDFQKTKDNIFYFLELKKKLGYTLPITRAAFLVNKNNYLEIEEFKEYWSDKVDLVEFQNFQVLEACTERLCPPGFIRFPDFACNGPWQQVVIRANADVLPCCSFYGHKIVIGNLLTNSIYELWHSHFMNELRQSLLRGIFKHYACQQCARTFYSKEAKNKITDGK